MKEEWNFDVLIIGGGHAGVEAAYIANQFSIRVGLISGAQASLASTPCNPAIGGVGKGQVVKELDALGGFMPRIADLAAIQYRTLNESKGYAIHSTRAQVDKEQYTYFAQKLIDETNISVLREMVENIYQYGDGFIVESKKYKIFSKKIIVTTGTFLNGRLHCGEKISSGGRVDCPSSLGMSHLFKEVKVLSKKFKTGTPPRLDKKSINFSVMEEQKSDEQTFNFSFRSSLFKRNLPQVSCFLTKTNEKTLKIIRDNKERSPLFNGQIQGIGPRYCPSIEDKAYRYPDRDSHHVFIEPEGLNLETIYPNGVSTSLPVEIQEEFLQTIRGLEKAKILVPGYAVEYEVVDTRELDLSLMYELIPGLYFAGQVNGTSGYEEAAAQGYVAGVNAALSVLGKNPLYFDRRNSYIGVLIEDLVTQVRDEPYRLFTARSENRLSIREDNCYFRMYEYRKSLGLDKDIDHFLELAQKEKEILEQLILQSKYNDVLKLADIDPVVKLNEFLNNHSLFFHPIVVKSVAIEEKYSGYIKRSDDFLKTTHRYDKKFIDWKKIIESKNISTECKMRIQEIRPQTFSQLRRIHGIRPATVSYVLGAYIK